MNSKLKISSLESVDLTDISNIQTDTAYYITENCEDRRTSIIADQVKEYIANVILIDVSIDKDNFFEQDDNTSPLYVIIDVSLIKRVRLAKIFNELYMLSCSTEINLYIFYSLAAYSAPESKVPAPNKRVSSVHPRFMGWDDEQDLNIMAIVGLGYEHDKATGAVEYLESDRAVVFIPTSSEEQYLSQVQEQNEYLIQSTHESDQIEYDVENPVKTIMKIDSVLSGCRNKYKPVLLPFGPKIFYACSLLVALVHQNASVWYVSGEENEKRKMDQEPVSTFGFKCMMKTN